MNEDGSGEPRVKEIRELRMRSSLISSTRGTCACAKAVLGMSSISDAIDIIVSYSNFLKNIFVSFQVRLKHQRWVSIGAC